VREVALESFEDAGGGGGDDGDGDGDGDGVSANARTSASGNDDVENPRNVSRGPVDSRYWGK